MFPESLRWRIQIWHGFLLAAVLTGLALASYRHQVGGESNRVDGELRERMRALAEGMGGPRGPRGPGGRDDPGGPRGFGGPDRPDDPGGPGGRPPPPGADREFRLPPGRGAMFEPTDGASFYYVIWRRDGSVWSRSGTAPEDIGMPDPPRPGVTAQAERTRGHFREAYMFTPPGECLLAGRSIAREEAALREYSRWLVAISGGVLVIGLAVGWGIATRAIRPIGAITSTARRIAEGEWSERIPVTEKNSELGRLSAALNETFAQLEESFARQSRFTADAAHELRTPVAIILAQAQRALTRERDVATYQQTLGTCVNAARRLQQLTESLLELAAHDAGAVALNRSPCDLAVVARETAALVQPLADERRIALTLDLAPAPCSADANRIAQVILNLLANALEHSPEGAHITLGTAAASGRATFFIADSGPGIAEEHLPRIFDRFYRADDSRNRRTGGAGLGLAICRRIVGEHRGTLELDSRLGEGTVVRVTLPVRTEKNVAGLEHH